MPDTEFLPVVSLRGDARHRIPSCNILERGWWVQNPFLQHPWEGMPDTESLPVTSLRGMLGAESHPVASEDADGWSPVPHTQPSPVISYQGFDNSKLLRNRRVTASLCLSQKRHPPGHSLNIWALILHLKMPPLSGRVIMCEICAWHRPWAWHMPTASDYSPG